VRRIVLKETNIGLPVETFRAAATAAGSMSVPKD